MPTLLNLGFCRITIYSNDHRPAHVHAIGPNWEAVFDLNCPSGPPQLRESFKVTPTVFRRVMGAVHEHLRELCRGWEKIHGNH